jgi:hypothetical protein
MNGHGSISGRRSSSGIGDLGSSSVVRATEGWLELFLTPPEKYSFSKWEEIIRDRSLVHQNTRWFFQYLTAFLPENLAPNMLTLAGFILLGNAWYLTNTYGEYYPVGCKCIIVLVF